MAIEARRRADTAPAATAVDSRCGTLGSHGEPGEHVDTVAFSPDGKTLASGDSAAGDGLRPGER